MARFYRSPLWRHLVTTRASTVVTTLDKLASNRSMRFELGGPSFLEGSVPSDDFRTYFPWDDNFTSSDWDPFYNTSTTDYPRVAEGVRLMYSFRGEGRTDGQGGATWVVRHAGPILEIEDEADTDRRTTRFVAFDPWAYLYSRPCRTTVAAANNPLPGKMGVAFPAGTPGNEIVAELLRRTIEEDGLSYIDAGVAYGGTAFYSGTMETTDSFLERMIFPRGTSVGEAWEQMVDTGTLDIVLTPIWDPQNRPGYCAELNIYVVAGGNPALGMIENYPAFRWDRSGRAITRINRLLEGRERANKIQLYGSMGGVQSGPPATNLRTDADSVTRFGQYWSLEALTRLMADSQIEDYADDELYRRRAGARTWRIAPAPEFSPRPFQDFDLGSLVDLYHSDKLREEQWWQPNNLNDQLIYPRVVGFTLELSDEALETVSALDISTDDRIT